MHILKKMYKYRRGTSPTKRSVSTTTLSIQHGNLFILYYFFSLLLYLCSIINFLYVRDRIYGIYARINADDARNLPLRVSPIRWRDMWRDFFHVVSLWRWRRRWLLQQSDAANIIAAAIGGMVQRSSASQHVPSSYLALEQLNKAIFQRAVYYNGLKFVLYISCELPLPPIQRYSILVHVQTNAHLNLKNIFCY